MTYPNWWNKTITIYHKREAKDENGRNHIKWGRTILNGCFVGAKDKKIISGNEILTVNVNVVRIAYSVEVSPGDIIVLSDTSSDEALTSELAIKKKYPDSFVVQEVHDNTTMGFLPHIYISG